MAVSPSSRLESDPEQIDYLRVALLVVHMSTRRFQLIKHVAIHCPVYDAYGTGLGLRGARDRKTLPRYRSVFAATGRNDWMYMPSSIDRLVETGQRSFKTYARKQRLCTRELLQHSHCERKASHYDMHTIRLSRYLITILLEASAEHGKKYTISR